MINTNLATGAAIYLGIGRASDMTTAGAFYGHPKQLLFQAAAALTVIIWDGGERTAARASAASGNVRPRSN